MVQHVVYQQTHLLYNRHLDQILLSALYGICKVRLYAASLPERPPTLDPQITLSFEKLSHSDGGFEDLRDIMNAELSF